VNRYVVLYLATLIILIPVEFVFVGIVAKGVFTSEVGDMLGEIRPAPAILFYLLYVAGVLIFVSGSVNAPWQTMLLCGALFGLFCYATFDLTSLSLLKHWIWPVAVVDVLLGIVRHGCLVDRRLAHRQLDSAEDLGGSAASTVIASQRVAMTVIKTLLRLRHDP
jgi:uncharacterized membrane protein